MEQIVWTEDFSIGVAKIDEQHKRLVQMLNRLIADPQTATSSETVSDLLSDMMKYAQDHFAAEEELLRQNNYPHLEKHVAQHRLFLKNTVDFCRATILDVESVPEAMLHYLREWLLEHILKSDMACKPYFCKQKGK